MPQTHSTVTIETLSLPVGKPDVDIWRLFTAAELDNPQLGLAWLDNLSAHALDPGDRAMIVVVRRGEQELVVLPVVITPRRRALSLSTFYTSLYQPLILSEDPTTLLTEAFRYLAKKERCSHLTLMPLDLDSSDTDALLKAQTEAGWRGVHTYFCFGNWIHDIDRQSYDEYIASRPSQLRNTIRRKQQNFRPGSSGSLSLITGADGIELETALEQYNAVYANSWKVQEPYPQFIPSLVKLAAARGWLRLGVASYNTFPVAAQIWLIHNGTAYIYKLAYDENYKNLSPGTVLTAFMFENVFEHDNVTRIDYLSGDDVYKRDWMTVRRERHGTAAYNPSTLRGLLALLTHRIKRLFRRRAKSPESV